MRGANLPPAGSPLSRPLAEGSAVRPVCVIAHNETCRDESVCTMNRWTSKALANATPEQLLAVLTHPQHIRRWSPVDFDVDDLESPHLAAGTRTKVTGRLAGVPVSLCVEVHAADPDR